MLGRLANAFAWRSESHDGSTSDAAALPHVTSGLRARGYGFVTLDALLG